MEVTEGLGYEEVDAEDFKDDIHYYLTKLTNENEKIILIKKGMYGEIVVMPREKFNNYMFSSFMTGLDEQLTNMEKDKNNEL